mgnify:CR=1 FL=1
MDVDGNGFIFDAPEVPTSFFDSNLSDTPPAESSAPVTVASIMRSFDDVASGAMAKVTSSSIVVECQQHETPPSAVDCTPFVTRTRGGHPRNAPNAAERMLDISSKAGGDEEVAVSQPVPEFICHLYSMLLEASYSDFISWIVPTEDETSQIGGGICGIGKIVVHNPEALQEDVLGNYYRHSKYASFQRQLNYFGFKKRLHNGKKGKLSPCSYIHELLTADMRSLFTLKRRPPLKRRSSEVSTPPDEESDSTDHEMQHHCENARISKRFCQDAKRNPKKRKVGSTKKQSKDGSPSPSPQAIVTWESNHFQTQCDSSTMESQMLHVRASVPTKIISSHEQDAFSREVVSSGTKLAPTAIEKQPLLDDLLSKSLPPWDILFNEDADSLDNDGVPAWVGDDGQYHYHNVDSHLVDLAMLF